ncbi:hypothetical protein BV898_17235 [Hypsibius exemplaris]|uniref:DUF3752 domain-containing protein n=1 Tax=Hypsibius exemplaris TaxID=2072580 RepID=A0A9X6NHB7_HYPEX|nr:hypothetical protein BV898_17235 [Hypsibius exemplaris]
MANYGPQLPPGLLMKLRGGDSGAEEDANSAGTRTVAVAGQSFVGPVIPAHLIQASSNESGDESAKVLDEDAVGPSLSSGFTRPSCPDAPNQILSESALKHVIGPAIPSSLLRCRAADSEETEAVEKIVVGPSLPPGFTRPVGPERPPETPEGSSSKRVMGPTLPSQFIQAHADESDEERADEEDVVGPSLPPGFTRPAGPERRPETPEGSSSKRVMGPTLPSHFIQAHADESDEERADEEDVVGPSLSLMASASDYSAVNEVADRFARKAEKLKKSQEPVAPSRESWMTDLPESLLGRNVIPKAALTGARTFKRKTDEYEADFSGWTSGPGGKPRKEAEKDNSLEVLQYEQALQRERQLELEIEANNKKKRGEALVTMTQKTKTPEELKERRPFDREKDLNIRKTVKMDQDGVAKRAAELREKFATSAKAGQKFL